MNQYVQKNNLKIHTKIFELINDQFLKEINSNEDQYWASFEKIIHQFSSQNNALLQTREILQAKIDDWCTKNKKDFNQQKYNQFLKEIGYLEDEVGDFQIESKNIDDEIAKIPGAQLVVPINNARYALNAANARFGSLYDALYGTNALSEIGSNSHSERSKMVIDYSKNFLNQVFALENGSFNEVIKFELKNQKLALKLKNNNSTELKNPSQFVGFNLQDNELSEVILKHNNLHIIIQIDKNHPIGSSDIAHIKDIKIESAISSIIDCEDSVAAVDGADKALVYKNWLGLMRGDLEESFNKNGKLLTRKLNQDLSYKKPNGENDFLRNTSVLLIRNVGHLTKTSAVLFNDEPVFEGMLDAYLTSSIAKINLNKKQGFKNSKLGSIYIVKPKMHGSKEVKFANDLYAEVEKELDLKACTIKLGVMDEERRTSVNLKSCIEKVKNRVCFINTGFLDRTGDEIHTNMNLAPVPLKADIKSAPWMLAYEKSNVDVGLECGFYEKAQIGKGMWAKADDMKSMLETKFEHLTAGASCAWVPSPTAASLHAIDYFKHDVKSIQKNLSNRTKTKREEILDLFILKNKLTEEQIQKEIENNAQGILGYVVRWINSGIGCSKVPDIDGVALMEDRATLRISSQHIGNWINHGIVSKKQVENTMQQMAKLVDSQNSGDLEYEPMSANFDQSIAFKAALELVLNAKSWPNGYTEPLLHQKREKKKSI